MPCIWGQHNNSQLFIEVGIIDALRWNAAVAVLPPATGPLPKTYRALIDTGAQRTMISTALIRAEKLTAIGKMPLRGIGPVPTWHNAYLFHVQFHVPFVPGGRAALTPGTPVHIQIVVHTNSAPIHGAEIASGGGFDILLGMDVISTGSLKVEGNHTFSWSF